MKEPATPEEIARLKTFLLDNFCFDTMKSWNFWPKGTRRADYAAQAARICAYFGYESVYEYGRGMYPPVVVSDTLTVGAIAAEVDSAGHLHQGGGYLLHTCQTDFDCPHCTKPQGFRHNRSGEQKCSGCKRTNTVFMNLDGTLYVAQ